MAVTESCSLHWKMLSWSARTLPQCSSPKAAKSKHHLATTAAKCQHGTLHPQVYHLPYYEACVRDTCGCDMGGDCECLCDAVAAYAKACLDKGVCVDWRTPDFCRECLILCPNLFHSGAYPRSLLSRQAPGCTPAGQPRVTNCSPGSPLPDQEGTSFSSAQALHV